MKNKLHFSKRSRPIALLCSLLFITSMLSAQMSGRVWEELPVRDETGTLTLNVYGTQEANENGVEGVMVTVYPGGHTTMTGPSGNWSIAAATTFPARVEFSAWPAHLKPNFEGTSTKTSIQFVATAASAANVNFSLHNPGRYSNTVNPSLMLNQYIAGDPTGTGTAEGFDTWFKFDWDESGAYNAASFDLLSDFGGIGATWGMAYHRATSTAFAAASVRRHSGLGTIDGTNTTTGGIYAVNADAAPYTVTPWLDVNTLAGVNTGADPRDGSADNNLSNDAEDTSVDLAAFSLVGKRGLGDIDVSEDDSKLYVVNLHQRNVLEIDIATKALLNTYTIADPGCANGDYRPWAIENHEGELYVGVTCSAETSQNAADLEVHVMQLSGGSFSTSVFSIDGAAMGYSRDPLYDSSPDVEGDWGPWRTVWTDLDYCCGWPTGDPAPSLQDIEIDVDGSLILGINDITGFQIGARNNRALAGDMTTAAEGISAGDILRATPNGAGGWTLESGGVAGGVTGANTTAGGPGNGQFYDDDARGNGGGVHLESHWGGMALFAGSDLVAYSAMDPVTDPRAGGVIWNRNSDGSQVYAYEIYDDAGFSGAEFSKANGLGDLELMTAAAPIEIGNLVWMDTDMDGVQDPNEPGIANVDVQLLDAGGALIATAMTDANGNYIFSNEAKAPTSSHRYGIALDPNANYTLRIPNATGGSQQAELMVAGGLSLSPTGTGEGANDDMNDSNGAASGTNSDAAVLPADIPVVGANNHTFDFGFMPPPPCNLTASGEANEACNANGTASDGADDYITFDLNPVGVGLAGTYNVSVDNGGSVSPTTASYGSASSFQLQSGSADGTLYTITITDATDASCTITTTVQQNMCSNCPNPNCRTATVLKN